ncbi:hypothetical protein GCM10009105_03750 [Dokdonella soli]|uniref:Uncharacterized protein n=1 Tax=Dokdonella soli TaxID=529810 RepID=A0ABN1ICZ4_9GAMM
MTARTVRNAAGINQIVMKPVFHEAAAAHGDAQRGGVALKPARDKTRDAGCGFRGASCHTY